MSFEDFWQAYPKRRGKGAARRSYARARKLASHEEIMEGVEKYRQAEPWRGDLQFCCLPATWLNQERWDDEYDEPMKKVPVSDRHKLTAFIAHGIWRDGWGRAPIDVPEAMARLDALGIRDYETPETGMRLVKP